MCIYIGLTREASGRAINTLAARRRQMCRVNKIHGRYVSVERRGTDGTG